MTITIIIDHMSMYCCINMYNTKRLYRFEQKNLAYLDYKKNCFNYDKCDFKVIIVLVM